MHSTKTPHIQLMLWLMMLILPFSAQAQKMTVESMEFLPNNITVNLDENLYQDNNGDYSGLVIVRIAAEKVEFGGGWILAQKKNRASEFFVFMAKTARKLIINVEGYLPLEVDFRDYGINGIESRCTYMLTVNMPQAGNAPVDNGMRYLVITVEPKNSMVLVDGKPQKVENGEMMVSVPKGKHTYQVMAADYATEQGEVEIKDEKKTIPVTLKSLMATLRVECPTEGSQIYLDNKLQGPAPWRGTLSPGNYQLEARRDGYRPQQQSVTLGENENRTVRIPALDMIAGSIDVRVTPVNADVYIDGKKVGTTPDVFRNIQVGNRKVEVRKDGYQPYQKTVTVKENEEASVTAALTAKASQSNTAQSGRSSVSNVENETITVNGVSFVMVRVKGGKFKMGATSEQGSDVYSVEKPTHQVMLSNFSIGETEVTQALWQAVMGNNPSKFTGETSRPVERVSWNDCQEFIKKLNLLTGKNFRLPTEAEWEYAARGGHSNGTKYAGSNDIGLVAWYDTNACDGVGMNSSDYGTHAVKAKSSNKLGLYDMSGNVWEWCQDWYDDYRYGSQTNPQGPSSGSQRVLRGGSWYNNAKHCRVSDRDNGSPGYGSNDLGLRLAF